MSRLKTILSKIYHIRALKYIVVVVIGIAVVGFVDENSIWHHFTNKQRISELQDEIDMYNAQYQNDQAQIRKLDSDPKAIKKIAEKVKGILVAELNYGQLVGEVERVVAGKCPVELCAKYDMTIFEPAEIEAGIDELVAGGKA